MPAAAGSRPRPKDIGGSRDNRGFFIRDTFSPGVGITNGSGTHFKTSVERVGDIFVTRILIDLTGLSSSTTDLDIIGTAGVSHIGQITTAKNGIILGGTMTCFEVPAGGADDIDLYSAADATGAYDGAVASLTSYAAVITNGAAWANGDVKPFIADAIVADDYLYLTGGEAGTAAPYTAGRFLLQLYGRYVA